MTMRDPDTPAQAGLERVGLAGEVDTDPKSLTLARRKRRKLKRLYDQRGNMMQALTKEYFAHNKVKMINGYPHVEGLRTKSRAKAKKTGSWV